MGSDESMVELDLGSDAVMEQHRFGTEGTHVKKLAVRFALSTLVVSVGVFALLNLTQRPAVASSSSLTDYVHCLQSHGIDVPVGYDPFSPQGSTVPLSRNVAIACRGEVPPPPVPPVSMQRAEKAYARCMRTHGIPVSDPTFGPGTSTIEFGPGVGPSTPGFSAADHACRPSGLPS